MLVICPHCQAENEDVARFCNQCGNPLGNSLPENRPVAVTTEVKLEGTPASGGSINWTGLIVVAVAVFAIWFMVGKKPSASEGGMPSGSAPMMEQVLKQVADLKTRLAENPGDVDTITEMYQLYAQVGKTAEVTPYVEAALENIVANEDGMNTQDQGDKLLALFIAAYENQEDELCLKILKEYHKTFPDNIRILKVLGDLSYDNRLWNDAIEYYGQYTDQARLEDDPDNYLNAMTDMGSCYIQLAGDENPDKEQLNKAIEVFKTVLSLRGDFWQAHFNLGIAHGKLGEQDEALLEWNWCRDNTESAMEKWRAEYAAAEMLGEELPPMPSSPHGEGFGMANPHGEGGMMNPHDEGDMMMSPDTAGTAPPLDGDNLPPNPHSEEFLQEHRDEQQSGEASDG
ncbi:zinc-ribbon domain-containing protein [bacterium]|nr:zinc-ribbon domain-containing protein [bacterium]